MKILLLFLLTLTALTAFPTLAATDPITAYSMAQAGEAVFIDVREAEELPQGMVKDAKWFPLSMLKQDEGWQAELIQETKGKTIFLYCRTGRRSEIAKRILEKNAIEAENIGGYQKLKEILPLTFP